MSDRRTRWPRHDGRRPSGQFSSGRKSGRRHPRTAVGHCPVRSEAEGGGAWAKRLVTIRYRRRDPGAISLRGGGVEDRSRRIVRSNHQQTPLPTGIALMSHRARRLLPLLIGLALILPAVVPTPVAASASDAEAMILKKMNYERTKRGLVALRLDTRIAAIARDRSQYQARTGDADHTQGSKNVFDFIQAAGIKWYAAGEIIAQNRYYPSVEDSAAAAIKGWLGSSTHRSIMLSKGYNYVGFGYAMNPDNQRRYWTGVFLKGPDRTAPVAQFEGVSKSSSG